MPKYLLLKHYRGGPDPYRPCPPMDQWAPEDVDAHMAFLREVARCSRSAASTSTPRRSPRRSTWVRYGGPGAAPVVTDGPHPETSDLVAGWYMIDVDSLRAGARDRGLRVVRARPGRRAALRVDRRARGDGRTMRTGAGTGRRRRVVRSLAPQVLAGLIRRGEEFAAAEDAVQDAIIEASARVAGASAA